MSVNHCSYFASSGLASCVQFFARGSKDLCFVEGYPKLHCHVEISNFPISLRDGLVIDVSFVCEFKGNSRAPGGWNNGVRHSNDVLQARANVKNNKYKDIYGLVTRRLHLPS